MEGAEFEKMFEIEHPFYYAEFKPESALTNNQLNSISSLSRITAYSNACERIQTFNAISNVLVFEPHTRKYKRAKSPISHIEYLDSSRLVLKNAKLREQDETIKSHVMNQCRLGMH